MRVPNAELRQFPPKWTCIELAKAKVPLLRLVCQGVEVRVDTIDHVLGGGGHGIRKKNQVLRVFDVTHPLNRIP